MPRQAFAVQAYSSRAACYMKLGEFSEAMKDAEKCIELEPKSSMGYRRKGDLLFHMEEYNLATETYLQGLHVTDGLLLSRFPQDEAVPEPSPDPKKGTVSAPADSQDPRRSWGQSGGIPAKIGASMLDVF
ncbi:hypothetical protein CRG98_007893 [Punica granatum]|uniref:Uncharacterized protein n=1 Tax=Punica granatum TaxID=22663 RepID=A0A2I0KTW3_PUNGR|nr:hypothetical protein CRG98_007893 [Punica granatum]